MKMICQCGTELRPLKNDIMVITANYPREIWCADLWECSTCGHRIVTGFGRAPIMTEYDEEFTDTLFRIQKSDEIIINSYGREPREIEPQEIVGDGPRLIIG